jgi:hypothetical protein
MNEVVMGFILVGSAFLFGYWHYKTDKSYEESFDFDGVIKKINKGDIVESSYRPNAYFHFFFETTDQKELDFYVVYDTYDMVNCPYTNFREGDKVKVSAIIEYTKSQILDKKKVTKLDIKLLG